MTKKKTTEQFIAEAKAVHGDKYDYSKVEYKGYKTKVKIICPIHGEFEQTPSDHINHGNRCPKCAGNAPLDTETFIARAKEVHGDKYDYSKTVYKGARDKVVIICPIHGEFKQKPSNHLSGYGCKGCKTKTAEEFITDARKIHGNKYDYSKVEYVNSHTNVIIVCPEHGEFKQKPSNHLAGKGCTECAFSAAQCCIYIATDAPFPGRFKIGYTNDPQKRLIKLNSKTPFEVVFLAVFEMGKLKRREVEKIERGLHSIFKAASCNYPGPKDGGFSGATEWFFYRPGDIRPEKLVSMIARLVNAASYRNYFHK
ncbi:TPA: GIY-YIG nuclease family protein [Escherichia coli]|nr:GIY-YIG nuclease family protein [Escherichia coli]HDV2557631.1 GIY-YIG nuclease family protein [Escherichia coli]